MDYQDPNDSASRDTSQTGSSEPHSPYQPPQQPPYNGGPVPGKGMAIASLVLGIISLCTPVIFAAVIGIVGIVLGAIARKEMPAGMTGMATAGMVMSIIATAASIIFWLTCSSILY